MLYETSLLTTKPVLKKNKALTSVEIFVKATVYTLPSLSSEEKRKGLFRMSFPQL